MAVAPAWFKSNEYFANKLAALGDGWDSLTLKASFESAGYTIDNDSLYQHFLDFGNSEGVSPLLLFNAEEYLYSKAADYYGTTNVTHEQAQSMLMAMNQSGMSPWDHYQQYGAWEESINPSASFDSAAYLADKLAQQQRNEPSAGWTLERLVEAIRSADLTPLSHYVAYGQSEGLIAKEVGAGVAGNSYSLTVADDTLYGTTGDDYFSSRLGTLNDGDYIDGGTGYDTLYAYVDQNNVATSPTVTNVEKVVFRAQGRTVEDTGNNNISATDDWTVSIDAGDISGMTYLGNDNSRADLAIEDVRTDSNKMTISFADTDPGDVDFGVFFNPQNLKAQDASVSGTLQLQLMDVKNAQAGNGPLNEQPFDSFSFQYTGASGVTETVVLKFRDADAAKFTGPSATYATLLEAFNNAIADLDPKYAGQFQASLGPSFNAEAIVGGQHYVSSGTELVINANSGSVAVTGQTGWGVSTGTVPPQGGIVWNATTDVDVTCPLIQTTVHLDNVGRVQWNDASDCLPSNDDYGSKAGDMVVGSMATRGGVERFDVSVDRGSWLSSLSSTNNTLRYVKVINDDVNGDGVNGNLASQANGQNGQPGQLYIGDSQAEGGTDILPDGPNRLEAWQDAPKLLDTNGLTDVKYFDGSSFNGVLNIGAQITEAAYAKYLSDVDGINTVYSKYAPEGDFNYSLGSNNDVLNMVVDGGIAADRDFQLNIYGGAGDDFINFTFDAGITRNEVRDINALGSVVIRGDAGNDTIKVWENSAVTALGGAGNDVIFISQTNADDNAVFILNPSADADGNPATTIYHDPINGAQPLNNDILSTSNAGLTYANATAGSSINVTVSYRGINSTIKIGDTLNSAEGSLTADQINDAIIKAINEHSILGNLFEAKDGAGHSLLVESLFDGLMAEGDLRFAFTGGGDNIARTASANYNNGLFGLATDEFGVDAAGTDNGTESISIANGGVGNDLIVLNAGSAGDYHDTVVFQSTFNNDTIVNFQSGVDNIRLTNNGDTDGAIDYRVGNQRGFYDVEQFVTEFGGGGGAAGTTEVFFVKGGGGNYYTAFKVVNDATAGITASEVTLLGTVTSTHDDIIATDVSV